MTEAELATPIAQDGGTIDTEIPEIVSPRGAPRARPRRAALLACALALAAAGAGGCGGGSGSGASGASPAPGSPAALLARGRQLYVSDGCSGCHTLNGTRLSGPSWKGLAGSRVTLASGATILATDAYLRRHIVEPDALTVRGFPGEVMGEAIESLHLSAHPADVSALVAFIDSVR